MNGQTNLSDNCSTTVPAAGIPVSWVKSKLGELLPLNYGKGLVKKKRVKSGEVPVYGSSGIVGFHDKHIAKGPALIIGRKGTVGKVHFSKGPSWPIDTTYFVEATPSANLKFFDYLLGFLDLGSLDKSTAIPGLSRSDYNEVEVYVPPLPEQRRIVAEIEKQFTRLDAAETALRRVEANLKRYRASVLKAACEGKLVPTEAELAEAEGRDYEPADQLLERILAERRFRWESQEKRRGKYKEPVPPDTSDLSELPEGWEYTSIEPLLSLDRVGLKTGPFGSLLKKHEHRESGVPVFGIENIRGMEFVSGNKIFVTCQKAQSLSAYDVQTGDILISRSGTVGHACVVPNGLGKARLSTNLIRLSLAGQYALPRYLCILLNGSPTVLGQVSVLCSGSTRDFLNRKIIMSLAFPLPPYEEQRRIIAEVDRLLSIIQQFESTVVASLKRVGRLRQSILKRAFSGQLVPQDPEDEPASVLLESIHAEREAAQAAAAAGGRKTRRRRSKVALDKQLRLLENGP